MRTPFPLSPWGEGWGEGVLTPAAGHAMAGWPSGRLPRLRLSPPIR